MSTTAAVVEAAPAPPPPPPPEIDESAPFPLWRLITSGVRIPNQPPPKDISLLKVVAQQMSNGISTPLAVIEYLARTTPVGDEEATLRNVVSSGPCASVALRDQWDFRAMAAQLREYREQNKSASRFAKIVVNNR